LEVFEAAVAFAVVVSEIVTVRRSPTFLACTSA